MNKKNILCGVLSMVIALGVMAGCSKTSTPPKDKTASKQTSFEKIKEKGIIKIGTEGTYKPFTYHNESNELVGYDVEVGKEIAKNLGVKVEFVEVTWEGLLASLDSGKVDLVLNQVGVTDKRKEKYDFSEPYLYSYPSLIAKKSNNNIASFEAAKGKKTSLNVSSNYALIAEKYGMKITPSDTFSKDIELLLSGRTDVVINNTIAFNDYMQQKPDTQIKIAAILDNPDMVSIPMAKGNEDLIKAVNKSLTELSQKGTLSKISEKYLKKDFSKKQTLKEIQK